MVELWKSTNHITDTIRDDAGNILSFKFIKYYGETRNSQKEIVVTMKRGYKKKRGMGEYLNEEAFFKKLSEHYKDLTDIKMVDGKIVEYRCDGVKYVTDKPETKKTFDFLPFKRFLRVTWQRFWDDDTLLRNGYFGGLVGCNNANIRRYAAKEFFMKENNLELYDIDINHAYPYNYHYPLPAGRFYSEDEWNAMEEDQRPLSFMKFHQIRIKTIKNVFGIYVPLAPYFEYHDLDFLISRDKYDMVVSEYRLFLIDQIYGRDAYELVKTYYCQTKIYLGLWEWHRDTLAQIDKEKRKGIDITDEKRAVNSVTGLFGKRDETCEIECLHKQNNSIVGDFFIPQYTPRTYKKANNYLPIAMVVNDITAVRLFYILTDPHVVRISWNTDGAIIGVYPFMEVQNSKKIGEIKSKLIYEPEFYSVSSIYNRPLVFDKRNNEVYNSNCITYWKKNFIEETVYSLNTAAGFKKIVSSCPIMAEPFHGISLRKSEIDIKLKSLNIDRDEGNFFKDEWQREYFKLVYPYDRALNYQREKPNDMEHYWKYKYFFKNFIKMS